MTTDKMPMHFFVADKSNQDWHDVRLESYLQVSDNDKTRFKVIESIHLFAHAFIEQTEICSYQVSFGRDDCMWSGHNSLKSLVDQKLSDAPIYGFKIVNKEEYIKLRAKTFELLNQHPFTDYEKLK
jgi:hypothetical protein